MDSNRFMIGKKARASIGRGQHRDFIQIYNHNDFDIEVSLYDGEPPDAPTDSPQGRPVEWLVFFKVHGDVHYTLDFSRLPQMPQSFQQSQRPTRPGKFYFWDGQDLKEITSFAELDLVGDPAIGRD